MDFQDLVEKQGQVAVALDQVRLPAPHTPEPASHHRRCKESSGATAHHLWCSCAPSPGPMAAFTRTSRLWVRGSRRGTLLDMEHPTPAADMPELYRAVLDTVFRLERIGERDAALAIRRRAVNTYSTRWDDGGRRELTRINRDAMRRLAQRGPNGAFSLEASTGLY
jgi:hypothetical protein